MTIPAMPSIPAAQRPALEPQADRREACRLKAQVGPPTPFAGSAPGYPARSPTSPPLAHPPRTGRKTSQPASAELQRGLRLGLPASLWVSRRRGHRQKR